MYAENDGVKIWYEVHGQGELTLVMIPGFQIAHSEGFKRAYVPFLSRHMRVVTMDLRGSGKSDKPEGGYDMGTYAEDVHAVVEAEGLDRFAMAGVSCGALTIIQYQAEHTSRVTHLIMLNGYARMIRSDDYPVGMPKKVLDNLVAGWENQPEAMLQTFIDLLCSEKYSLRDKELIREWAHETTAGIWAVGFKASTLSDVATHLEKINLPTLIINSQDDKVILPSSSEYLHQKIRNSNLITVSDAGHGFSKTWPQVNRHILTFLKPEVDQHAPTRLPDKTPKVLWISSPIGLGHVKRDLAIAEEMRKEMPNLTIHWLSADPVRSVLEGVGEHIHPLSDALWDEAGHFEHHSKDYSLDVTEAYWKMDKLLANNFMVFTDAVRQDEYDLVVGDESWEVADYLHYNPSLKTAPFVFMTDLVGALDVSEDPTKQAHVENVNGTWVEMREIHPEASDLSIFIGEEEDIPDIPFGEGLPNMRQWTEKHFRYSGYVLPFDPDDYSDRQALREALAFSPEEKIILVAVGGTSVGRPLIDKCLEAQEGLIEAIPGVRTIILCGPRIDHTSFGKSDNVEFRPFIQDPVKLLAACDLAVIQGGLSTAMELTALGRPFLYFPLKEHFEQQQLVTLRLKRYGAGIPMDFDETTPDRLVKAIATNMDSDANYKSVNRDGAKKVASMVIELLQKGRNA